MYIYNIYNIYITINRPFVTLNHPKLDAEVVFSSFKKGQLFFPAATMAGLSYYYKVQV